VNNENKIEFDNWINKYSKPLVKVEFTNEDTLNIAQTLDLLREEIRSNLWNIEQNEIVKRYLEEIVYRVNVFQSIVKNTFEYEAGKSIFYPENSKQLFFQLERFKRYILWHNVHCYAYDPNYYNKEWYQSLYELRHKKEIENDLLAQKLKERKSNFKKQDIKLLFLISNSSGNDYLLLDKELNRVEKEFRSSGKASNLNFVQRVAVTPNDIQSALIEVSPNIVHFSGHGNKEGIKIENEIGEPHFISNNAISKFFKLFSDEIKCIVLNSCESSELAYSLIEKIPYVVAMNSTIDDDAAIAFSIGFYRSLLSGNEFRKSYNLGLSNAELNNLPDVVVIELLEKKELK